MTNPDFTPGRLHLYYGEGKGKTTCAVGLAVRAAGRGIPVVIAQFLKSENTGERFALRDIPSVMLLPLPREAKFTFRMTEAERLEEARISTERLEAAFRLANESGGLLILDEICAAVAAGMVDLELLLDRLEGRAESVEVVLTGRDPAPELMKKADYMTEFVSRRHPYERGIPAREGIEY